MCKCVVFLFDFSSFIFLITFSFYDFFLVFFCNISRFILFFLCVFPFSFFQFSFFFLWFLLFNALLSPMPLRPLDISQNRFDAYVPGPALPATDCCHICFFLVCFVRLCLDLLQFCNVCASTKNCTCKCCQRQFVVDLTAVNGAQAKLELSPNIYIYNIGIYKLNVPQHQYTRDFMQPPSPFSCFRWQWWLRRSHIVFACVKIIKKKKICSMHDTAVFHLNIYTYRILCERLLLSSPPLLLHYRLPSQLLPTRYVCLRFVPQASARRFSASPLTQSYLPNKRRVTRQDDAFYVLCAGRKCAIFTFYTTPSSLLQPTSPRSLNSYPFFLYFWISTHFYSLLTFSRRFIS